MNPLGWLGGVFLLLLTRVFEETSGWFARQAIHVSDQEGRPEEANGLARSAREARLAARLSVGLAFALAVRLVSPQNPWHALGLVAGLLAWAWLSAVFVPMNWRSPLGLLGLALFRPVQRPARGLGHLVRAGGRFPGLDAPSTSLDRIREVEEERRWLVGQSEEPEAVLATLHEFGSSLVEDVMLRREEVVGIPADAGLDAVLAVVAEEGHSRYPVYRESLDSVVGVLHVFDLLTAARDATAGGLARPPLFTNATKPVSALLRELQVTYNQMAVVVDEFGGTAGIVTVEDLLEELVGEIGEEEEVETLYRRVEPGVWWVDATARIDELNEALDLDLEEGEYDTVAGLLLERLERIPRPGERVRADGVWVEVVAAEPHRVEAVRILLGTPRTPGRS